MQGATGGRKLLKRKGENRKSDVLKNKSIKDYMIRIKSKAKPQGGFITEEINSFCRGV